MAITYVKDIPDFKEKVEEYAPAPPPVSGPTIFLDLTKHYHGTFTESLNYTAPYDCYIIVNYLCKNGYDTWIKINDVYVQHFTAVQRDNMTFSCFLKKDQTITTSTDSSRETTFEVFGLTS